jgi:hypothetical protein
VRKSSAARLGLIPLRGCVEEQWLMCEIARALRRTRPDVSLTIVGSTLDDFSLMRIGNTFVTGAVEPEEFERAVKGYGLQSLFASVTRPIFGHPTLMHCLRSSLPLALFDWSRGGVTPRRGDLTLDPRSSLSDIVSALGRWLPTS